MIKESFPIFSKFSHSKEFTVFSAHVDGAARQQGCRRSIQPQGAILGRLSLNARSVKAYLSKKYYTHDILRLFQTIFRVIQQSFRQQPRCLFVSSFEASVAECFGGACRHHVNFCRAMILCAARAVGWALSVTPCVSVRHITYLFPIVLAPVRKPPIDKKLCLDKMDAWISGKRKIQSKI